MQSALKTQDSNASRQKQANIITEIIDERMATKSDLRELEYRLNIRFVAMIAAAVAVLAAFTTFTK